MLKILEHVSSPLLHDRGKHTGESGHLVMKQGENATWEMFLMVGGATLYGVFFYFIFFILHDVML